MTEQQTTSKRSVASAVKVRVDRLFRVQSVDFYLLLGVTGLLLVIGLIMGISASTGRSYGNTGGFVLTIVRQIAFVVGALIVLVVSSLAPVRFWKRIAWPMLGFALLLQLLVFTPLGEEIDGNRAWITIGDSFSLQPAELVKVALAVWIGAVLAAKQPLIGQFRHVLIPVVPVAALALGLVLAGHDLGTVIVMTFVVFGCLIFAGVKVRHLLIPVVLGGIVAAYFVMTSPNRLNRISTFLQEGCSDYTNLCFQPLHGTWALASGGVFGLGLGNSREKYWLPAIHNDYIFALIGEELGLIGAVAVLLLFGLLAVVFMRIITRSSDPFVRIVTGGVSVWLLSQAAVNIAVVLGLLPVLGVPLPLLSSGGTALLTTALAIGIVLSFTRERSTPDHDTITVTSTTRKATE
ncbi:peptidoglycan glycosyltransferase FtsW [Mycetocola reblochoni]|uniref:Probable peptidoglycan glycosyltransferase FtsW n=2 Tax=Mycetocola reblochoni TaxID=331618 RepID=A0A1R4J6Q5_9MICO|nr:putative peptidoglycan glycosyltransferase FtsW [Mycetocola reblochoni]RLP69626.1 cell division protein FtsW [Mycetocola reblochoni]SJN27747.1 Cell division protein FtsW [Mycetocola reblochoni REB411]